MAKSSYSSNYRKYFYLIGIFLSIAIALLLATPSTMERANNGSLDNKKTKICVLTEPNPITYTSGLSLRIRMLLKHFAENYNNSYELEMITADAVNAEPPKRCFGYIPIHYTLSFRFPLYRLLSLSCDLTLKVLRVLFPFPRRERFDLMHVSSPGMLVHSSILASRLYQIPLLMSYHTHMPVYVRSYIPYPLNKLMEIFVWKYIKLTHSFADLTLLTSPQMAEEFAQHGIPRTIVWQKGVDTTKFHPDHQDADMRLRMSGGNSEDLLLVYIGRLGKEKRLKDLRGILEKMNSDGISTRLCIAGHGPAEDELQAYFQGTRTTFLGVLHGLELVQAFASGDIFVMPSDSETLGFVVLESMASGVPVVAARAGGPIDLIDHGRTGYLASTGDTENFVEAIRLLRDDTELHHRISLECRKEAELWSWEASMEQIRQKAYPQAIRNYSQRWSFRIFKGKKVN